MSVADFMSKFGRKTVSYWFYDHTVEVRFDKEQHIYYLVQDNGSLKPLDSVSQICHIVDKSKALVPWACKMMMQKLFLLVPKTVTKSGKEAVIMEYADFEKAVQSAKTAHKDKLEDAGQVGNSVHDWVERYIKLRLGGHNTEEILSQFPFDPRAENGCTAALAWMGAHNVRWIDTEKKIYSREFEIPGTMDGIAYTDSCSDTSCCPNQFKDHLSVVDWKTSNQLYIEYIMQVATYEVAEREENGTQYDDAWIIRLGKEDGEFDPWYIDQEGLQLGWKAFRSAYSLTKDIKALEEYQKARKQAAKLIKKVKAEERKEAKLRETCPGAAKYKGIRPPRCNGGDPCRSCIHKYVDKKWLSNVLCLQLTSGDHDEVRESKKVQTVESNEGGSLLGHADDSKLHYSDNRYNPGKSSGGTSSLGSRDLLRDLLQAAKG